MAVGSLASSASAGPWVTECTRDGKKKRLRKVMGKDRGPVHTKRQGSQGVEGWWEEGLLLVGERKCLER